MNRILLQVEGLTILALSIYVYSYYEFSWWLFLLLLFVPDFSMVGYLVNNEVGSWMYNLFHTYSLSVVIVIFGLLLNSPITLAVGIIWFAHIGMDRMLGYGLKYPTAFKDTHLNRV